MAVWTAILLMMSTLHKKMPTLIAKMLCGYASEKAEHLICPKTYSEIKISIRKTTSMVNYF